MDKTKLLRFLVVGLVLLNTACIIFLFAGRRHGPPFPPPMQGGGPKQIIVDRLHFDAAQQEEFGRLVEVHHHTMDSLVDASKHLHDQLYSLLKSEGMETQADSLMKAIGTNEMQLEQLNFNHFKDIRKLCKPEQKADFDRLADDLGSLFHKGPPGPPPSGPPPM
ncbi:MAG: Spy/CpxP family protein refolding chaperone [Bacteroidia bacterium]